MKKINPGAFLFFLLLCYWMITIALMFIIDSRHPGGEQYFLRIFVQGINYFPVYGIIITGLTWILFRDWAKRRWYILSFLLLLFIILLGYIYI